jgi:phage terminase large subunit-like protein
MMDRNIYVNLASENNNNQPGIRPTTNKMQRFNVVVPWFKAGKIYFPEDMKQGECMRQALDELKLVCPSGFKSKHDDFSDTVSMLALLNTWVPAQDTNLVQDPHSYLWSDEEDEDIYDDVYDSYVV